MKTEEELAKLVFSKMVQAYYDIRNDLHEDEEEKFKIVIPSTVKINNTNYIFEAVKSPN
jgi:hypothetical protein